MSEATRVNRLLKLDDEVQKNEKMLNEYLAFLENSRCKKE